MNLEAVGNKVLVRELEHEVETEDGILLSRAIPRADIQTGIVESIGDRCDIENLRNSAKVVFGELAGYAFDHEDVRYRSLDEDDVLAVIE